MGGMATCMSIRHEEGMGRIPITAVLMLLDRAADTFLARRADADGWLIKPLDAFRLRRAAADPAGRWLPTTRAPPWPSRAAAPIDEDDADSETVDDLAEAPTGAERRRGYRGEERRGRRGLTATFEGPSTGSTLAKRPRGPRRVLVPRAHPDQRLVGKAGFEPATSSSRTTRTAKLRHFPVDRRAYPAPTAAVTRDLPARARTAVPPSVVDGRALRW